MNNEPLFDFTVDKAAKTVTIKRTFNAPLELVWDAFTKAELLDQWYAPQPFVSKTRYMNFEVGGKRFYAMVSPDGQEKWALQTYTSISPKTNFKMFNVFADKDENPQPPGSDWNLDFSETNGTTLVHILVYNESFERMESLLEGFKAGFSITLGNLENLLASMQGK